MLENPTWIIFFGYPGSPDLFSLVAKSESPVVFNGYERPPNLQGFNHLPPLVDGGSYGYTIKILENCGGLEVCNRLFQISKWIRMVKMDVEKSWGYPGYHPFLRLGLSVKKHQFLGTSIDNHHIGI